MYASKVIYTDKNGKTYELYYPIIFNPLTDERFEFTIIGVTNNYSVKAKGGLTGKVAIPSFYRGGKVTQIEDYAFFEFNSKITAVEIPSSITHIGLHAFERCSNLVDVNIPDSVTSIGEYAFYGCSSLEEIDLVNGATYITKSGYDAEMDQDFITYFRGIGKGMFGNCTRLTNVSLPNDIVIIDNDAFSDCTNLVGINLPSTVREINDNAFAMCHNLEEFSIPTSVTYIGFRAFQHCYGLTRLVIPRTVTKIEQQAFLFCKNLTLSVSSQNTNYYIKNGCLIEKETKLILFTNPSATVSSDATGIGSGAFSGNTYFAPIKIPLSITRIESLAFQECENLVLHVEAESKPDGWDNDWCDDSVQVIWGYKEDDDTCDHNYGGWVTTVLPTCTKFGMMERTCSVCGEVEIEAIEPLGHDPSDWIIDVQPTVQTEGSKHKECTRCGEILETESIPKLDEETYIYLVTEDGAYLTDEQGNLLII